MITVSMSLILTFTFLYFTKVMQFGRIDGNAYILDFQYPFSAVQAFAVALANVTQRLKWYVPSLLYPELYLGFKCNLLVGAQLFDLRLINFDFGEKTKISPGYREREKYNHAALHNAATRVGAISIGCIYQGCPQICTILAVSGTLQCM